MTKILGIYLFCRNIADIELAIRSVKPRGDSTNVGEAIATVRRMIERQANRAPQVCFQGKL